MCGTNNGNMPARLALWAAAVALVWALLYACSSRRGASYEPSYKGARRVDVATMGFDDGDTFEIEGETIRLLGVDTPEIAHPQLGVMEDQPYGVAASESTRVWLTRAELVEYVPDGLDRYDRRLAHVFIDRELLAVRLLEHALAYETVSFYGDSGFPDLAQRILDASRSAPKPDFEEPYKWKRKQRKKAGR